MLFCRQGVIVLGLLDYGKNHNHIYFGQYCNHDYLKWSYYAPLQSLDFVFWSAL